MIPNQPYPWLIICDGEDDDERYMIYNVKEKRYHPRCIPELQNKGIDGFYNEWLVMWDDTGCSLLNILTMEKHKLPPLGVEYFERRSSCVLSSPPTDEDCRVLYIRDCKLWCYYVGDNECIEHDFDFGDEYFMTATNFEGKLHILTFPDFNLYTAAFSDSNLQFSQMIRGDARDKIITYYDESILYLVESCGELLLVHYTSFDREVLDFNFFKADFTNKEWVMVENLGDIAIFLDDWKCISISKASMFGLKENTVYYVNNMDRSLYAYDVEDRSISMSLPCPIVSLNPALFWVSVSRAD